jgi:hypothetical protein
MANVFVEPRPKGAPRALRSKAKPKGQSTTTPIDQDRLREVMAAATAFTRRMALSIATMPAERRPVALELTERALRASIVETLGESPIGDQWLQASMAAIRELIAQIEMSGGAEGGRA